MITWLLIFLGVVFVGALARSLVPLAVFAALHVLAALVVVFALMPPALQEIVGNALLGLVVLAFAWVYLVMVGSWVMRAWRWLTVPSEVSRPRAEPDPKRVEPKLENPNVTGPEPMLEDLPWAEQWRDRSKKY